MLSLRQTWDAARVRRFHAQPLIGEQTVADHSWGVAMTVWQIAENNLSEHLLVAALVHDLPERIVGDTPSTAKWRFPHLREALGICEAEVEHQLGIAHITQTLNKKERDILKWADLFELLQFATHQRLLGNSYFARMCGHVYNLLAESVPTDSAKILLEEYANGSE